MGTYLAQQSRVGGFTTFGEALGSEDGFVALDLGEDSVQTKVHPDEHGQIRCTALATAVSRLGGHVDLVKMDCEGAEWELLQDAESWLRVQRLAMEYHLWAGYTLDGLRELVRSRGFEIHSVDPCNEYGLLFASRRS